MQSCHPVIAFLPMRKGSQRIPNKNTCMFGQFKGGLCELKLRQLAKSKIIDEIVVSTESDEIKKIALGIIKSEKNIKPLSFLERPDYLYGNCTTDELIDFVIKSITPCTLLWTHATSPFFDSLLYDSILAQYFDGLHLGFDSLLTVSEIRSFIFNKDMTPLFDRTISKWPRTQTIQPLFEVNSAAFIIDRDTAIKCNDRIGFHPILSKTSAINAIDVDEPHQFQLAEQLSRIVLNESGDLIV